jgi:hypothetical protein
MGVRKVLSTTLKVKLQKSYENTLLNDPEVEGSVYTYASSTADLVAANGDILYQSFNDGIVIGGRTEEHPENAVEYWSTPLTVLGGTGRFEGAKGELNSNDYVTADQYTHHHFYGKITLLKGNRK